MLPHSPQSAILRVVFRIARLRSDYRHEGLAMKINAGLRWVLFLCAACVMSCNMEEVSGDCGNGYRLGSYYCQCTVPSDISNPNKDLSDMPVSNAVSHEDPNILDTDYCTKTRFQELKANEIIYCDSNFQCQKHDCPPGYERDPNKPGGLYCKKLECDGSKGLLLNENETECVCDTENHWTKGNGDSCVCDAKKHYVTDGANACICDATNHFVSNGANDCICDAANHFVSNGANGCICDAKNGWTTNGSSGCMCNAEKHFIKNSANACVCDATNHFVTDGANACVCDAANHFVTDGINACICDAKNGWATDGSTGCMCNTTKHFVQDGANACKCDAENGWISDNDGNCTCNAAEHWVYKSGSCVCDTENHWKLDGESGQCVCEGTVFDGNCWKNFIVDDHAAQKDDIIIFGTYPQSSTDNTVKEDLKWRVLHVDNERHAILLISEYVIDAESYHDEKVPITWENSSIRNWLTTDFIRSNFLPDEQKLILLTHLKNPNNPEYNTLGGNDTEDRVFLLSFEEAKNPLYFTNADARKGKATAYTIAKAKKLYLNTDEGTDGVCEHIQCSAAWWLRSPGNVQDTAADITRYGNVYYTNVGVADKNVGIRPAMWVKY